METTRRRFLRAGMATLGLGLAACASIPGVERRPAKAAPETPAAPSAIVPKAGPRTLVVVQMAGGNDGLNTVIPLEQGLYHDYRPNLSAEGKEALPLNDSIGLHSNLKQLKELFDQGKLAVVQSAGYPNPNRSHFRSMEIWQEAVDADKTAGSGWLGRYLDIAAAKEDNPFVAVNMGVYLPKALGPPRRWPRPTSTPA